MQEGGEDGTRKAGFRVRSTWDNHGLRGQLGMCLKKGLTLGDKEPRMFELMSISISRWHDQVARKRLSKNLHPLVSLFLEHKELKSPVTIDRTLHQN